MPIVCEGVTVEFEGNALKVLTEQYYIKNVIYCKVLVKRFRGIERISFIWDVVPCPTNFLERKFDKEL